MILKLLLNSRMIWEIFIKILKNTIQIKKAKQWLILMKWLVICLVIKKLNPTVTELVIRVENWNIYFTFITESYFAIPKNIRLNSTH